MYHVTEYGPRPCGAVMGRCPYKGNGSHFDNAVDAQAQFEKSMEKKFGAIPGKIVSQKVNSTFRQKYYRSKDKVVASNSLTRSIKTMRANNQLPTPGNLRRADRRIKMKKFTMRMGKKLSRKGARSVKRVTRKALRAMIATR